MEIPPKLLLSAIGAIYNGTISSITNYPLYFVRNGKVSEFYAYRLRDVLPTRLISRFYYVKKDIIAMDLLWLVDNIKAQAVGQAIYTIDKKNKRFNISGSPLNFIIKLKNDALINSCYPDLSAIEGFLDRIVLGSIKTVPPKMLSELNVDFSRINSPFYAFSRSLLKTKHLPSHVYQDDVINAILALIDVIHKSLEILIENVEVEILSGPNAYCHRCGMEIPENSYYCPFCGAKQ